MQVQAGLNDYERRLGCVLMSYLGTRVNMALREGYRLKYLILHLRADVPEMLLDACLLILVKDCSL